MCNQKTLETTDPEQAARDHDQMAPEEVQGGDFTASQERHVYVSPALG